MTKLKEKLITLGYDLDKIEYDRNQPICATYTKHFIYCHIEVRLYLYPSKNKHFSISIKYDTEGFADRNILNNLKSAYNEKTKDLKILQECEEDE